MRRLLSLCLMFAFAAALKADIAPLHWNETGVAIRQGYQIEWQRAAETDEAGNVIYVWSDTRNGDRDIYAQKVAPSGGKLWDSEGLLIVSAPNRQEDPALIPTGFGDYIFIWNDFRNDITKGDLYAQKVSSDGVLQWDPSGILLSTGDFDSPASFRIVADGTGGAIILWGDYRNGNEDIYATRVLGDGSVASGWTSNGTPVTTASAAQSAMTVDTDGAGGAIVAWVDNRPGSNGTEIYIQRLTVSGQLAWGADGVIVCNAPEDQESPKLCPDGSGGAYITWVDKRQDSDGDIYFQHISSTGTLLLPEIQGRSLISLAGSRQEKQRIVADGSGNAIIIWQDTRNDPVQNLSNDIYAQKINSAGDKLWNAAGNPVCLNPANQGESRLNADGTGGAVCTWEDERDGNENPKNNIFAQKINADGTMGWTTDGVAVCQAPGFQYFPLVRSEPTYSLIAWGDDRSGSKGIWFQKLNAAGLPQLSANGDTLAWGYSGDARYPALVQNDLGQVFVFFQDLREGSSGNTAFVQLLDTTDVLPGQSHVLLEPNGRPICPGPVYSEKKDQEWIDACQDGDNGAIAIWVDKRDSNPYVQIYAQRLSSIGTLQWGDGGLRVSPPGTQADPQKRPKVVEDGEGGAIVLWSAFAEGGYDNDVFAVRVTHSGNILWTTRVTNVLFEDENLEDAVSDGSGGVYLSYLGGPWPDYDLFAQRVGASGNLLWGDGVPVSAEADIQINSRIVGLGASGAILFWEDRRNAVDKDIYAQKFSAAGVAQWATNGIPVVTENQDQIAVDLARDNQGHILITWEDFRNGVDYDLYVQKMTMDGQMLFATGGVPFCVAANDQTECRILSDETDGFYAFWTDYRGGPTTDIYGIHLDGDGLPYTLWWSVDGSIVNDYLNKQANPFPCGDYARGSIVVWEDKRSSGKDEIINLYAQRMNEYVVGIEPERGADPPRIFQLYQPYPNPFNPDVQIQFELDQPGSARLAVYDLQGRRVTLLLEGHQTAGHHTVSWRPEDAASGIYLVRLEFDGRQIQRKVLLLK